MKPWWERWPGRLEWELDALQKAGLSFHRDEKEFANGRIVLLGTAPIGQGESTDLIVVYPDLYPETRFTIFAPNLKLPRHQEPFAGNLCVFPRDSRYWRPQTSAAEIIAEQIPKLVALVRKGGEELRQAEDPQGEPYSEYFPYYGNGGIIVPETALEIPGKTTKGKFVLRFRGSKDWLEFPKIGQEGGLQKTGTALLEQVQDINGNILAKAPADLAASFRGPSYIGYWSRVELPADAPTPQEFYKRLSAKVPPPDGARSIEVRSRHFDFIGAVFSQEIRQGETGDSWTFWLLSKTSKHGKIDGGVLVRGISYGRKLALERIPELTAMPAKRATLFGLGTLGSPIAVHMCKAQIGTLAIADFDFADPNTGVRSSFQLDGAGAEKTLVLSERLSREHPFTQIHPLHVRIGDGGLQRAVGYSEQAELVKLMEKSDIVIDATAESNVTNALWALCSELKIPFITVFSIDGIGGVIARLRPGETGCIYCLEYHHRDGLFEWPKAATDQGKSSIQTRGCADRTFTAALVDLEPLSTEAARIAFGTLCAGGASGYPDLGFDVVIAQLRTPERIPVLPAWKGFKLPKHPECQVCR